MTQINLKSAKEIAIMKAGGQKLKKIRTRLKNLAKPGVKLENIEALAQKLICEYGGQPSFAMVDGYFWATCINLNQDLVHGVPDDKVIKEGDLVSIDTGLYLDGFHTDSSVSFIAGDKDKYQKKQKLTRGG